MENNLVMMEQLRAGILYILLSDISSNKNIIWATDSYLAHSPTDEIKVEDVVYNCDFIPRALKNAESQKNRTKAAAEVFTPDWVCREMTDFMHNEWKKGHSQEGWEEYIKLNVIEPTCGEAPFIVSRYSASTALFVELADRYGLLDRKLALINKKVPKDNESLWKDRAIEALQHTYGYEFQGDNLLIARVNIFVTVAEYYQAKFKKQMPFEFQELLARIISSNFIQMDAFTYKIPYSDQDARIHIWSLKDIVKFKDIVEGRYNSMDDNKKLFNFCCFNPPYQLTKENTSDKQIYPYFLDEAYKICDNVISITPGRFLFNAGKTHKQWNEKMLSDEYLSVLRYEPNSSIIFNNTDIKGGVVILYHGPQKRDPIGTFTAFNELNSILSKIDVSKSLADIVYYPSLFMLDNIYADHPECKKNISSDGQERKIVSNAFEKLTTIFFDVKPNDGYEYIQIFGRKNNERTYMWVRRNYINTTDNLNYWKVFVPASNGTGAIGEVLSTPVIGSPVIGHNQTFISIGRFNTEYEANACLKYIKTKFARTCLGICKATQNNKKATWRCVPLQDFTDNSDIDWSLSVAEIDQQLYTKYNLSNEEINFIETHVKEME